MSDFPPQLKVQLPSPTGFLSSMTALSLIVGILYLYSFSRTIGYNFLRLATISDYAKITVIAFGFLSFLAIIGFFPMIEYTLRTSKRRKKNPALEATPSQGLRSPVTTKTYSLVVGVTTLLVTGVAFAHEIAGWPTLHVVNVAVFLWAFVVWFMTYYRFIRPETTSPFLSEIQYYIYASFCLVSILSIVSGYVDAKAIMELPHKDTATIEFVDTSRMPLRGFILFQLDKYLMLFCDSGCNVIAIPTESIRLLTYSDAH